MPPSHNFRNRSGMLTEYSYKKRTMVAGSDEGMRERNSPGHWALPQLVAIDDCARIARHIVEDGALNKRVYARVAEQDQRRTIIIAARIARDLPSLREQLVDRQRCLRCRQAGRRQHRC